VLPPGHFLHDIIALHDRLYDEELKIIEATLRAANSRDPRGPTGPLGTPFWTPSTLSGLTNTH
jgi:hypothetical protein